MDLLNVYGLSEHINTPNRESYILDLIIINLSEQSCEGYSRV